MPGESNSGKHWETLECQRSITVHQFYRYVGAIGKTDDVRYHAYLIAEYDETGPPHKWEDPHIGTIRTVCYLDSRTAVTIVSG